MGKELTPAPWLAPGAREWLETRIEPGWAAFEWGSGGSTLWLESLCGTVVSVEHDPSWWARVNDACREEGTLVALIPPEPDGAVADPADPEGYCSSCRRGRFRDYARFVEAFEPFDLVLVDGRARASCLARAAPRVKEGGLLVLDNAERGWYLARTAPLLEGWARTDFRDGDWLTSAWEKPRGG